MKAIASVKGSRLVTKIMSEGNDTLEYASTSDERLLERFAAAPIVTVSGVVDARGASGVKSQGDELWTLNFAFSAWRIHGEGLQTTRLGLSRRVTEEQSKSLVNEIDPYSVLRVSARVVVDPLLENPQAFLEAIDGLDTSDQELSQHAVELQRPVTRDDSFFGMLSLDRGIDRYTGQTLWCGALVEVSFKAAEEDDLNAALRSGYSLWQNQEEWKRRIQDYAVAELLPLKNDVWLGEDEEAVTPTEFCQRMVLDSITVGSDGYFEFWHSDGDLFFGHYILIGGNLEDGPTEANIPG